MYFFAGTHHKRSGMCCRFCTTQTHWSMPETALGKFPVRDAALMEDLAAKSERITVQKLRKSFRVGPVEKAEWSRSRKCANFTESRRRKVQRTTSSALARSGAWSPTILWPRLTNFDKVMGTRGMSLVDEFIKRSPLHQSFSPVCPVEFSEGISCYLKA